MWAWFVYGFYGGSDALGELALYHSARLVGVRAEGASSENEQRTAQNPAPTYTREEVERAIAEFDVGGVVRKKVSEYPLERLEALVLSVAQHHLKTIELFGAVIGFFIGVVQAVYFWLTYTPRP